MILDTKNTTPKEIAILKAKGLVSMGGHKKLKIYGQLKCPSASRYVAKGQYVSNRVLFQDEKEAKSNGYRPCGCCMKEEYKTWKSSQLN